MKIKDYSAKDIRIFGILVGIIFLVLGSCRTLLKGQPINKYYVLLPFLLIAISFIYPRLLYWPYRVWMFFGRVLGRLNTCIILGIVYYAVLTPMAVIMRLFGYDPLKLKFNCSTRSYKVDITPRKPEHFEHLY